MGINCFEKRVADAVIDELQSTSRLHVHLQLRYHVDGRGSAWDMNSEGADGR
jgi:hypothetical protein